MKTPLAPVTIRFGLSPRACWARWVEGWKKFSRSHWSSASFLSIFLFSLFHDRTEWRLRQHLRALRGEQHRGGDEIVALARAHQPGQHVEAHADPDFHVGAGAQAGHLVAARPGGRHADTDGVAAMMAAVVRKACRIRH